jgi:hypothetical protein
MASHSPFPTGAFTSSHLPFPTGSCTSSPSFHLLELVLPALLFTNWSFDFQSFFFSPTGASLPVIFHPPELSPLAGMKERERLPPVSPVTFMLLLCLLELSPLVGRKERELPQFFHQFTCCKQQVIGEDVLDELATELTNDCTGRVRRRRGERVYCCTQAGAKPNQTPNLYVESGAHRR